MPGIPGWWDDLWVNGEMVIGRLVEKAIIILRGTLSLNHIDDFR